MEIKFSESKTGIPMIELGEIGTLTFSRMTANTDKGYKYMCFHHTYDDIITEKRGDRRKQHVIKQRDSYVIDMFFQRKKKTHNTKAVGLPHNTMPSRLKDFLKKKIKPLLDDNDYMAFMSVNELKEEIDGENIEKILEEIQKERKKRGKKNAHK